jgi:hypothetical protein
MMDHLVLINNILLLVNKKKMNPAEQFQHALKFTLGTIETVSKIGDIKRSFYTIIAKNDMTNDSKLKSIKNLIFTIRSKPYDDFKMSDNRPESESIEESAKPNSNSDPQIIGDSTKETKSNNMLSERMRVFDNHVIDIITNSITVVGEKTKELDTLIARIVNVLKNDNLTDELKINEIEKILL